MPVAAPVAPSAPAGRHAAPETIRETSFEKSTPHAKPTDAEIREFLDAFKRGDFLDLTEHELTNPPIEPDERFYMGGEKESRIQYDGVDVDMSADENYNAPQAPDYLSSYVREEAGDKDEELPDMPASPLAGLSSKVSGILRRNRGPRAGGAEAHARTGRDAFRVLLFRF